MRPALLLALAAILTAPLTAQDAGALYLEYCATCHGEKGDGKGVTPLAKPARSFLDGGFSYGNTRTAIGRTVEHGIPGTPMPSFAETLTPEQRASLVEYVIALGPPRREVQAKDTVLEVSDRPQVVRGYLPALGEGVPEWTRGLLVGLTSGTTFQYRADDVRLLAVRQGEFVERRDWSGRGGNPLRPLGRVTHLVDGGNPRGAWSSEGKQLRARLTRTAIRGDQVEVHYDLMYEGRTLAQVVELPRVLRASVGAGFERELRITSRSEECRQLLLQWSSLLGASPGPSEGAQALRGEQPLPPRTTEPVVSISHDSQGYEGRASWIDGEGQARFVLVRSDGQVLQKDQEAVAWSVRPLLKVGEPTTLRVAIATLVDAESADQFRSEVVR